MDQKSGEEKGFQLAFKNQLIHNMKVVFFICTHKIRITTIYICIMIIISKYTLLFKSYKISARLVLYVHVMNEQMRLRELKWSAFSVEQSLSD